MLLANSAVTNVDADLKEPESAMSLPSGTVTFLFTDIEGSTRLWEQQPEAMRDALARHDTLLRSAIEDNSGVVFKTVGDAFCAAFSTALDALKAALAAQCALHAATHTADLSLRVRMAMHTGAAELRDNDYFGQPLSRVARLLSAGHGGQTLLSDVAHNLTQDTLPPAVLLRSLGEHRLKDLGRPEPVFQLIHPDLPSEFPPLKSLNNADMPNNLPQQVTSFIGREQEIEAVKFLLDRTRLLTLTGSGGCGKTRLALQVAADILEKYPEGVWLVELAALTDPTLVVQTVAQTLNVTEEPGKPRLQTLLGALASRRLLIILDNCEHLLDACAHLADALLTSCHDVHILASSREGLGIAGETLYRIPSLSLPDLKQTATPASLFAYESVRLFVDRSAAALPAFTVTDANAYALASVCHRLDGIPLAIELASARVRSLSLEEINARLDNRFRLLTGGSRTALPRQQTLRALIDWSYDLLNPQEKRLFCRLSVFAGGWTLEAAAEVGMDAGEEWEALDLLTSLIDKSLVVTEPAQFEEEHTRYHLMETVRQYARDRLMEGEGVDLIRGRHQAYFAALAEAAAPHLAGPNATHWLRQLESEHSNLRTAIEWGNDDVALGIAVRLFRFWEVRGHYTEGRKLLAETLSRHGAQTRSALRASALNAAGVLAGTQSDQSAARALLEESLTINRELGNKQGIAHALGNLSTLAVDQGDYTVAQLLLEQCLSLLQDLNDKRGIARSLGSLGSFHFRRGDHMKACQVVEQSLALYRELDDKRGISRSLGNLSIFASDQGNYAVAQSLQEAALAIDRELGNKRSLANSLHGLGCIALEQGDYVSARPLQEESLILCREIGDKMGIARALLNLGYIAFGEGDSTTACSLFEQCRELYQKLENKEGIGQSLLNLGILASEKHDYATAHALLDQGLTLNRALDAKSLIAFFLEAFAALAARQQKLERSARLWGAAEAIRKAIGTPLPPYERVRYDRWVMDARDSLGAASFAAAWEQGSSMTIEQAIEYALQSTAA